MANNERLGASFTIDTTNLKAGLNQANRLIRESESEFKAAAAGMDDWSKSEDGLNRKIKSLNDITDLQRKKVDALQEEYDNLIANGLDPTSREAVELRTKINNETAALNKNEAELKKQIKALEELGEETEDAADAAEDAADGFTVMKGAAAELVANGITAVVGACADAVSSFIELAEETRETRENMAKVKTSFESVGLSAEEAEETLTDLYGIIGDDGAASEATQQLAKISKSEKDLTRYTRILTGVMAEYGTSIPTEGLAEGMAATVAMGEVQGVLADALEWQGKNLDEVNEKLGELSTEEERAAYIQDELIDLYGDSADAYMENNKSVIAARKETAKYTDQMAELGEAMEPVSAEITSLKTKLAQELTPVIKSTVAPAITEFIGKFKESGVIEGFGKTISFVAENFTELATVTYAAVTAYSILTAAMKITTAITAAQTAISGLAAGTSVATKVWTGFNAVLSANPIGAVLTAVGLLAGGIALLVSSNGDATAATDLLNESQREAVNAAKEAAAAYEETKKAAAELAAAEVANIDHTKELWRELQTLANENGEVKKGYEGRAEFIIGQLNEALGTEYTLNNDIIEQYGVMKESIETVISTKRAEIMLQAYEETYLAALENRSKAEQARAILAQELVAQEERVKDAQVKAAEARAKYQTALEDGVTGRRLELLKSQASGFGIAVNMEKEKLAEKQAEYNKSEAALYGYYADIANYEKAHTLILSGEIDKASDILSVLSKDFKTVTSTAALSAKEQKKVLQQQVIDTEVNAQLMKEAYAQGVEGVTAEMVETAKSQADAAKEEFLKVGGEITKGIAEGAEEEEWTLTKKMSSLISKALAAAKKAAGIKSPAREFKKPVGGMISLGVAEGVEDETPSVVKSIQNQVKAMRAAYNVGDISGSVKSGVKIAKQKDTDTAGSNGGVVINQTNNYKQAYSRRIEQYKARQQLFATARMIKTGAI